MKFTVFQSDKGDCLVLESGKTRVMIDGGMKESFRDHVRESLSKMGTIDVLYVSHIDRDHVFGLLQLTEDMIDWRVFRHLEDTGSPKAKKPAFPEPPEIKQIWHNAFHETMKDNAGEIADMLAATATVLGSSSNPRLMSLAAGYQNLANSVGDGIELSRNISASLLDVPLNKPANGKLMMVGRPSTVKVGGLKFFTLGPTATDLRELRKEWNAWLGANKKELARIRKRAARDEDRLTSGAETVVDLADRQALMLGALEELRLNGVALKRLGDRNAVTAPNLASLMFYVEEGTGAQKRTALLTGDGHSSDIIKGLKLHKKLKNGGIHVDVLKVQHHGSEHNLDLAFCQAVTADHYIFCGNGAHTNPETDVIDAILASRMGSASEVSPNPQAGDAFKFWFNSSEDEAHVAADVKQMKELEAHVTARTNGQFKARFLRGASKFVVEV
jgi:beta-lactamase superfamily II metal-dependent hydrolase